MDTWKFKLLLLGLIISFTSHGQITIKGLVYDKVEPTPGVTVTELGTENKVMTDMKGEFEIKTKTNNPTLTFTFTGFYPRTIKIKKSKFLKVKMKWEKRGHDIAMRLGQGSNVSQHCVYVSTGVSRTKRLLHFTSEVFNASHFI